MNKKIEERLSKEVEKILSDGIINCEEIDLTQEKLMKAFNQVLEYQKSLLEQDQKEFSYPEHKPEYGWYCLVIDKKGDIYIARFDKVEYLSKKPKEQFYNLLSKFDSEVEDVVEWKRIWANFKDFENHLEK